jgi:acyl-CoA synthetase (AMP-forming)/AMP-acid ligase II
MFMNYADFIDELGELHANRVALDDGTRTLTYHEFSRETRRVAGALDRLGLQPRDAIVVLAENRLEHLILMIAAARKGLIFAPLHPASRGRELAYMLDNCRPKAAFVEPTCHALFVETAAQAALSPDHIIEFEASSGDSFTYEAFLYGAEPVEAIEVEPDHPLLLFYSSGTSSMPKPIVRSHRTEKWSAVNYARGWNFEPGDKVLIALSLAWAYGIQCQAQSALAAGATIRIMPRFSPVRVLEVMERERITTFAGSVSMYPILLDVLEQQPFDISSVRKIFGGAEPRNETAIARTEARFGCRLHEAYALSESSPVLVVTPNSDINFPTGTVGLPVSPDVEIRLVDEAGRDVEPGQPGEAWIRSPGSMLEYYREPELTAKRIGSDGWLRTGDFLRRTPEGFYFFAGRQTDLIIRGGANISPGEIESVLIEHDAVRDAVVTGIPSETKGEDIVAGVVLEKSGSVNEAELLEFLGRYLSPFKIPQQILFLTETPTGKTGKKSRGALKEIVLERKKSQTS